MAELPVPTQTETPPTPESSPSREKVLDSVNHASSRYEGKVRKLHGQIDSGIEIDDLADTGKLDAQQKEKFAQFRTFQKGIRGLTKNGDLKLSDSQEADHLSFEVTSPAGEKFPRSEGIDISGLLDSIKEDISETTTALNNPTNAGKSEDLTKDLQQYQGELKVIEDSSMPFTEVFPDVLDESTASGKARLAEEARRIEKNPLTKGESDQENWEAAKQRLHHARLLKIPAKSPAEPIAEPKTTPIITTEESPIVITKPLEGVYIPPKATLEPEVSKTLDNNVVKPTDLPRFDSFGEIIDNKPTSGEKITTAAEPVYGSKIKDLIKGIKESGTTKITDVIDKIGTLSKDELAKLDSETRKRVDIFKKLKIPNQRRSKIAPLLVAAAIALASLIPRSTIANSSVPEMPQTVTSEPAPGAPFPTVDDLKPLPPYLPAGQGFSSYPEIPVPPTTPLQSESIQPNENGPIRGKTAEDPIIETEIKAGQTVRGVIVDALKNADPTSSPQNTDQAASLVLWKILADNPNLVNNPDQVHPGDKMIIPGTLDKFMAGFNSMDPQRKAEIIDNLNHVPNTPEDKKSAISMANELYTTLRYSSGGTSQ